MNSNSSHLKLSLWRRARSTFRRRREPEPRLGWPPTRAGTSQGAILAGPSRSGWGTLLWGGGLGYALFALFRLRARVDGLEEERRLMYVAITRARRRLYLSFSQTRMLHGQTRYNIKSRFLDELPTTP